MNEGRCHPGHGLWSLLPLGNGNVSPLQEPEGCVSHGRGCALLRWMHLGAGAMPGQELLTGILGFGFQGSDWSGRLSHVSPILHIR